MYNSEIMGNNSERKSSVLYRHPGWKFDGILSNILFILKQYTSNVMISKETYKIRNRLIMTRH